nr:MAG TPA: hypothetical protein [Caudoviricetes sp.]
MSPIIATATSLITLLVAVIGGIGTFVKTMADRRHGIREQEIALQTSTREEFVELVGMYKDAADYWECQAKARQGEINRLSKLLADK